MVSKSVKKGNRVRFLCRTIPRVLWVEIPLARVTLPITQLQEGKRKSARWRVKQKKDSKKKHGPANVQANAVNVSAVLRVIGLITSSSSSIH